MSILISKKDFGYMGSTKKQSPGRKENVAMRKAVLFFGGTLKTAIELKVNQGNVSRWLYSKLPIPIKHAVKIEELTQGKIKAKDLRPDLKWLSSLKINENQKES